MEGIEQIISSLEATDRSVTLWINSLGASCTWMDGFWQFMSEIKVWFPMYALIAFLLIWRLGWKKGLIAIAAIVLTFVLNERVNNLIKALVMRERPCNDPGMIDAGIRILEHGGGWSFPSGHANNSLGFALGSYLFLKKDVKLNWCWYGWVIIIWATLVSISRIMVACHFLGDILAGGILGLTMAFIWYRIGTRILKKVK